MYYICPQNAHVKRLKDEKKKYGNVKLPEENEAEGNLKMLTDSGFHT